MKLILRLHDIQKGKNYDANSAYTEPGTSWDMNRITTLLSGKKIKLTSPNEVSNNNNNNEYLKLFFRLSFFFTIALSFLYFKFN